MVQTSGIYVALQKSQESQRSLTYPGGDLITRPVFTASACLLAWMSQCTVHPGDLFFSHTHKHTRSSPLHLNLAPAVIMWINECIFAPP